MVINQYRESFLLVLELMFRVSFEMLWFEYAGGTITFLKCIPL